MKPFPAATKVVAVVFVTVLANCLLWATRIPYNGAPDEYDHLAVIRFVAESGRLPVYGEGGFRVHLLDSRTKERVEPRVDPATGQAVYDISRGHFYELRQPYLFSPQTSYRIAGHWCRLTGGFSLLRARVVSALWIALAALCVAWTVTLLAPARPVAALVAGLGLGSWPQITFLGAYANDDAFTLFAATAVLLACTAIEVRGWNARRAVALGVALGLVGLAKYYGYALFPLALVWAGIRLRRDGRPVATFLALSLIVAAAVAAPHFIRSAMFYDGDAFGLRAAARYLHDFSATLPPELTQRTRLLSTGSLHEQGAPFNVMLQMGWLKMTALSFVGRFGWMERGFGLVTCVVALVLAAAAAVGSPRPRPPAAGLFSLPLLALLLVFSLYNSYFVDYQPQGRYLLAALPALWVLIAPSWPGDNTQRRRALPTWALFGLIVALNLTAIVRYV
jgi:4-amino-4-deoxy-L-arabinose transferase-like glycosyltransferase